MQKTEQIVAMSFAGDDMLSMGCTRAYEAVGEKQKGLLGLIVNRRFWLCIIYDN